MVDIIGKGMCPLCNREETILIDYKYKKMCIDCYTEEILKEISLTIVNKDIFICLGDDGTEIGKGIYGVFSKREWAEKCKENNKNANIQIFERVLNFGNYGGIEVKDYSKNGI